MSELKGAAGCGASGSNRDARLLSG